MNLEELEEELENILPPGFSIETDSHGKVVIFTNLRLDEDGELVPFDGDEDEDDEDLEVDPDFEPLEEDDEDEE